MEKKIPRFLRQNYKVKGRVGDAWRKPRGIDNKQRIQKKGSTPMPRIGYRSPRATRGLHPSGKKEMLVFNPAQLSLIDQSKYAGRIAGGVGGKKRAMISKKAKELGIKLIG